MKPIATHPFGIEALRDRKPVSNFGMPSMEGRVEAGNLQQVRLAFGDRADWGKVVGLMQWSKRNKVFEPVDDRIVDDGWFTELRASMHHAVADRCRQPSPDLFPKESKNLVQRRGHIAHVRSRRGRIDEDISPGTRCDESRLPAPNTVDLSFHAPVELVANGDRKQLKLDARATRIDDKNGLAHR